ncbi:MAG: 16S rRNA (guanine(527)-N(7))-methyltransferase RsmG [Eubacteriales bacterium]
MNEIQILQEGFASYGLPLTPEQEQQFLEYTQRLLETNQVMNLTAITDPPEVMRKHHLDSVYPLTLSCFTPGCRVVDVGCGAGFPGLPIKLARPDISLTLLDSLAKRVGFLQGCVDALGLEEVTCIHARAEEAARQPEHREQYDVAVSRAVANLRVLVELCGAYVKVGGVFVALKGPGAAAEVEEARTAVGSMGFALEEVRSAPIPGTDLEHCLVILRKKRPTPSHLPRPFGKIRKKPL